MKHLQKIHKCNTKERLKSRQEWYDCSMSKIEQHLPVERNFTYAYSSITNRKVEVEKMAKEVDLKTIISNLAKLGVSATMTKSRLEMLKALAPPAQDPQIQSQ
jgi:tRNA G26 N,N-dimethylase Trm1